jgi:hypothetical protein
MKMVVRIDRSNIARSEKVMSINAVNELCEIRMIAKGGNIQKDFDALRTRKLSSAPTNLNIYKSLDH